MKDRHTYTLPKRGTYRRFTISCLNDVHHELCEDPEDALQLFPETADLQRQDDVFSVAWPYGFRQVDLPHPPPPPPPFAAFDRALMSISAVARCDIHMLARDAEEVLKMTLHGVLLDANESLDKITPKAKRRGKGRVREVAV